MDTLCNRAPIKHFGRYQLSEPTMPTAYHAKYFAHELTKRSPSGDIERITAALMDSQVDLNPHQVDAALFACRSPLSNGAILADEVDQIIFRTV